MTSCLKELFECVLVKIKVRGHLVMSMIQFMNIIRQVCISGHISEIIVSCNLFEEMCRFMTI